MGPWKSDTTHHYFVIPKRATVRNLAPPSGETIAVPATIAQDPSSLTLLRMTGERSVGMSNAAHRLLTTLPKISEICGVCVRLLQA